jgi:hypothetical protein
MNDGFLVLPPQVRRLVADVAQVPGVVALVLGGSRAGGEASPDSDWDIGLYYDGWVDPDHLRGLGYPGHIVAPREWGPIVNGGGWLTIDGLRVDLLYRELAEACHWAEQAAAGCFEVHSVSGHAAGLPTYILAGEFARCRVLHLANGTALPRPVYPDQLRLEAPPWWRRHAAFALVHAETAAARGDVVGCAGQIVRALIAVGHARLAEQGEWVLNEKRIIARAGLEDGHRIVAALGDTQESLLAAVERTRHLVRIFPADPHQLDSGVSGSS